MKIKAVIFNHNQKESAEKLFLALKPQFDLAFFDSGSREDQISSLSTHRFDNLYWTGCWNKAWELFCDYDVVWGIGGDCELRCEPAHFRQAIESACPFGIWSPAINGRVAEYMKVQPEQVVSVNYVEGIAFAISRSLWQATGELDRKNHIGWGQDIIRSHQSKQQGMSNLIDGRVTLFHPPSNQYNMITAQLLMVASMRKSIGENWQGFMDSLSDCNSASANTICINAADVR